MNADSLHRHTYIHFKNIYRKFYTIIFDSLFSPISCYHNRLLIDCRMQNIMFITPMGISMEINENVPLVKDAI